MTFQLMCVHITFSLGCVAEWPVFWKELLTRLTIYCILTICNLSYLMAGFGF